MGLNNIFANSNYMKDPVVKWCFRVEFYKDPDSVVDVMNTVGGVDVNGNGYASNTNISYATTMLADGSTDLSNAVKKISFPSPTINSVDVHFMGFVKSLPSVITQNGELEITFHDDGVSRIFGILRNMFPKYHRNHTGMYQYMDELSVSLYTIKLYVYDYNTINEYNSVQGDTFVESDSGNRSLIYRYEFQKCWMSELNHGNEFSYDSEDISEITCKFKYSYVERNSNSLYKMYQQAEADAAYTDYENELSKIAEQDAKWQEEKAVKAAQLDENEKNSAIANSTFESRYNNDVKSGKINAATEAESIAKAKEADAMARSGATTGGGGAANAGSLAAANAQAKAEEEFRRSIGNGNTSVYDENSVGGTIGEYGLNAVNYNKYWQQKLVDEGYLKGGSKAVDGDWGKNSKAAYKKYQKDQETAFRKQQNVNSYASKMEGYNPSNGGWGMGRTR